MVIYNIQNIISETVREQRDTHTPLNHTFISSKNCAQFFDISYNEKTLHKFWQLAGFSLFQANPPVLGGWGVEMKMQNAE